MRPDLQQVLARDQVDQAAAPAIGGRFGQFVGIADLEFLPLQDPLQGQGLDIVILRGIQSRTWARETMQG